MDSNGGGGAEKAPMAAFDPIPLKNNGGEGAEKTPEKDAENNGCASAEKTAPEKEAAAAGEEATSVESTKGLAGGYWACLKSKVRAAGEYATLITRQGITMFGEPQIGSWVEGEADDGAKKMASTET